MNEKFTKLYEWSKKDLTENLLPWWMTYGVDKENGGFYGRVDRENRPVAGANKFIVLNARLIWTFSSAYRVLGDAKYKAMADRAYEYFVAHFWDKEYDGCFAAVDAQGNVADDRKFIYGNAFAIYAFSEYSRATGSPEALEYARKIFAALEKFVYDPTYKGYFECCNRDWKVNPWLHGVNRLPTDEKTMNTHLHLIEAYTCLLRVDKRPIVRNKVREHLYVMLNKIVNHDIHHYHYFQDRKWAPTSTAISFGHDIEGSWLMTETCEVLGEPEAARYSRDICVNMARAVEEEGLREDGVLLTEYDPADGEWSKHLSWWEQNEAVVGFLNAWEMTGEEHFLDSSLLCMGGIEKYFIDREFGGWHMILDNDGKSIDRTPKIDAMICPYHNARMHFEIIERYEKHHG